MSLDALKQKVASIEAELSKQVYVVLDSFERNNRKLHLALTERFQKRCRKGKVWKAAAFLTTLKNAEYGFDPQMARSIGGRDGIFLLDRNFKPANEMMHKIFDHYLDKQDSGVRDVASALGTSSDKLLPVRLVSHHMRLLGLLYPAPDADWLILVDYDQT